MKCIHLRWIYDPRFNAWFCDCGQTFQTAIQRALKTSEYFERVNSQQEKS